MINKHEAEEVAELLGDPLPADWRDEVAIQARADHLAVLAYAAADAGLAMVHHRIRQGRLSPDDEPVDIFHDALVELDKGLRTYTWQTQRGDGTEIAYTAVGLKLGPVGVEWISRSIARIREAREGRNQCGGAGAVVLHDSNLVSLQKALGALLWAIKAPGATSQSPDVRCAVEAVRAAVGDALARGREETELQATLDCWAEDHPGFPQITVRVERP